MTMNSGKQSVKQPKSQHIGCEVKSCSYNTMNNGCSLQAIQVAPRSGCNTGQPLDESACASYEAR